MRKHPTKKYRTHIRSNGQSNVSGNAVSHQQEIKSKRFHIPGANTIFFWGSVCLIAITVLLAYSNSYSGTFLFDDRIVILENPTLLHLWPLGQPQNSLPVAHSGANHVIFSRPITNWTFAFNYALGGFNVFGYHLFNVLMHVSSALLVFGIVRRTLLSNGLKERWARPSLLLALSIALLWASHPLATHAINYITQRLESLAGFFYLATLYCFIRSNASNKACLWLSVGVITAFLGMGSKETMVTAPVVILLYDRAFVSGSFKKALLTHSEFYFGLLLAWGFLAILLLGGHSAAGSIGTNERGVSSDTWSYAATQLGVVLYYLRLTVWPDLLVFDNYWPAANTLNAILWPALAIAVMMGLTLWGFLKNKPWAFIGIWFFVVLSPSSSFVPIADEYLCEYRMYLPMLAPISLLVLCSYAALKAILAKLMLRKSGEGVLNGGADYLFAVLIATIIIVLGVTTYKRNADYASEIIMWSDNVKKTPDNSRAYNGLGSALVKANQSEAAIAAFQKAIELNPNYSESYSNIGLVLFQNKQFDAGIEKFREALALNSGNLDAYNNLQAGLNLFAVEKSKAGNKVAAITAFREVLRINPENAGAKKNLQTSLNILSVEQAKAGNKAGAIESIKEVLAINPENEDAKRNLPILLGK